MDNLLDNIEFATDFKGRRDRLVIELLYGLGLREGELVNLRAADINTATKTITILGKGNKQRRLPLSPALLRLIEQYQQVKQTELPQATTETLIVSNKGEKAYAKLIHRM